MKSALVFFAMLLSGAMTQAQPQATYQEKLNSLIEMNIEYCHLSSDCISDQQLEGLYRYMKPQLDSATPEIVEKALSALEKKGLEIVEGSLLHFTYIMDQYLFRTVNGYVCSGEDGFVLDGATQSVRLQCWSQNADPFVMKIIKHSQAYKDHGFVDVFQVGPISNFK